MSALELIERQDEEAAPAAHAPLMQLSVMEHAMRGGATPEQLLAAMQLQVQMDNHRLEMMREKRRMDEEDRKLAAKLAFRRDFAAFTGENIVIPKGGFADRAKAGSFSYAEYGTAMKMLSPALSRHGFSIRHDEVFGSRKWTTDGVENDIPWVYVTCYLEHREGHSEQLALEGPPGDATANTPVQNMQLTGSYLKRQSVLAITGTATADEDDESRLRKKGGQQGQAEPDALEKLLQAGRDASMQGTEALSKWWASTSGKDKNLVGAEYMGMKRAAAAADKQGAGQ